MKSCDAHPNQPEPPLNLLGCCADYADECPGWRSLLFAAHLSTERIAQNCSPRNVRALSSPRTHASTYGGEGGG